MKKKNKADSDPQPTATPQPHKTSSYRSPYGGFGGQMSVSSNGHDEAKPTRWEPGAAKARVNRNPDAPEAPNYPPFEEERPGTRPIEQPLYRWVDGSEAETTEIPTAEDESTSAEAYAWSEARLQPRKASRRQRRREAKSAEVEAVKPTIEIPSEDQPTQQIDAQKPYKRRLRRKPKRGEIPDTVLETLPEPLVDQVLEGTRLANAQQLEEIEKAVLEVAAQREAEQKVARRRGRRRKQRAPERAEETQATDTAAIEEPGETELSIPDLRKLIAPAWGWRVRDAGRASHVGQAPQYQATTSQACGLFPFVAGSGSPAVGVPIGRHLLWGETVSFDPIGWVNAGLVTNPGCFVLGSPGIGKSAFIKRVLRGSAGFGIRPFVLGDVKPDYPAVIERLGGQVIRVGRGLDKINPLDTGPLGQAALLIGGEKGHQLRIESRGRRLNALIALLTLVRGYALTNGEHNVLAGIVDILDEQAGSDLSQQPTVPDVLDVLRNEIEMERLMEVADVLQASEFYRETKELRQTLNLLCSGSLKGVFDGQTSKPIDLNAPGVAVDISQVASAGDTLVAAAMLSTWAYGFSMIDGSAALAEAGLAPRRQFLVVMDELWRALRGAPGLVEFADALTRVNRAKGVADIRATHSLADLEALPTAEDRAKARGFVERAGVVVLGGLPPRELDEVARVVPLSDQEQMMVSSWSAPDSWAASAKHPGRGKYLIKSGQRTGIPVKMDLVADEDELYNTDVKMLQQRDELLEVLEPVADREASS